MLCFCHNYHDRCFVVYSLLMMFFFQTNKEPSVVVLFSHRDMSTLNGMDNHSYCDNTVIFIFLYLLLLFFFLCVLLLLFDEPRG